MEFKINTLSSKSSEDCLISDLNILNTETSEINNEGHLIDTCISRKVYTSSEAMFETISNNSSGNHSVCRSGIYSTTSSLFSAENTIVNPNIPQILYCIASSMQAKIYESRNNIDEISNLKKYNSDEYEIFNLKTSLRAEVGGIVVISKLHENIITMEACGDKILKESLLDGSTPLIDTVYRFLHFINDKANYSVECNIIALVYLNRMACIGKITLTIHNWRMLWVVCILIAQKVWDDKALHTSTFSDFLPDISKEQLREMERKSLRLIDYTTGVKPSLYAKYYFELRELHSEIVGPSNLESEWNLKPLSIEKAILLEEKSQLVASQRRAKVKEINKASKEKKSVDIKEEVWENSATKTTPSSGYSHTPGSTFSNSSMSPSIYMCSKDQSSYFKNISKQVKTFEDLSISSRSRVVLS